MLTFALNLDIVDGFASRPSAIFGQDPIGENANGGNGNQGQIPMLTELVFGVQQGAAGASYWMGILLAPLRHRTAYQQHAGTRAH